MNDAASRLLSAGQTENAKAEVEVEVGYSTLSVLLLVPSLLPPSLFLILYRQRGVQRENYQMTDRVDPVNGLNLLIRE